ncbi:helix-turn-helix domain-containing protein [Trinickia dinghuensis]|uniref:Helix-turn-helix domain-containing protein n=1 Tax=Trinickia dinghuensis TaxID=2291023 RepID=A0A3D8K8F0_9BURK|nr:helix-turn-helix domain-containing protein [Trinickia dinghuensis]RDV00922.1 helix-turn-helix domain-containing protein [Trinickia dinghuensis]
MSAVGQQDITISTHTLHCDERVDFWIDGVARALVHLECNGSALDGIDASLTKRGFSLFNACEIAASRHAIVRSSHSIRADQRDAVFVCVMTEGNGYTFQGVDCVMHKPGDVVIYDTASPYGHGFPGDMSMTVLDIPRHIFETRVRPWRYRDLIKIDHADGVTGWAVKEIRKLLLRPSVSSHEREDQAARVLELLQSALLIRDGDTPASRSTIHTLQRAKAFIDEHLSDEALDCDSISRAMKLSPRQLARVFEIEGVPITRFIWARRLERCRADLRNPSLKHLSVSEIAFRWGFNNSAHFSRSYRARYGVTPTQARIEALDAGGFPHN